MSRSITLMTLALGVVAAAPAQYNFYSSTFSGATGVSNNATAVGTMGSTFGVWNPTVGGTPTSIGGAGGNGQAGISANGAYVGATALSGDAKNEIARYDVGAGTWTTLGGAGGYSGTTRSVGWGISGDGSTVFGYGYGTPTGTATFTGIRPISNKAGVTTDYSIIPNASSINRIMASSTDGSKVAGRTRYYSSGTTQADGEFYWAGGGPNSMYATGTSYLGDPGAMSGDGRYVAGSGNANNQVLIGSVIHRMPYIYDTSNGTWEAIPTVAALNGNPIASTTNRIDGFLTGMSADGNTAVGFFRSMAPSVFIDKTWGFIWHRGVGVESIDLWAANNGVTGASSTWLVPMGISADGQTIVGSQFNRTGAMNTQGFMLTTVPEPGTLAVLGLGGLALLRRRRSGR